MMHPLNKTKDMPQSTATPEVLGAPAIPGVCVIVDEQYPVTLDTHVTLHELLLAGNYDSYFADEDELQRMFVADSLTEEVTLEPFCFDYTCTFEHMLEEIARVGYRAATLRELLAVGAQHPELQRRKVLVALGSANHEAYIHSEDAEWALDNALHIPLLADILGNRMLILGEYDGKHRPGYYFLCVRN